MTPDELNKLVAERLGWKHAQDCGSTVFYLKGKGFRLESQFDWSTSLDAIARDLLPKLCASQQLDFILNLAPCGWAKHDASQVQVLWIVLNSIPEQLCRAFLAATKPKEGQSK